jgi:2,3-dihydroxybiphenyl 1,2-dioxygenase
MTERHEGSEIQSLGYVGVNTRSLEDWLSFGTRLLGFQVADRSSRTAAFRMDQRQQRLVVQQADSGSPAFFGWEVEGAAALDKLAARLEASGVAVTRGARATVNERAVTDLISFGDPAGNRLEAFYGAARAAEPFRPGRTLSGFLTEPLGMGHAVLTVERIDAVLPFYRDVLGFRMSDYILRPFKAYFFHLNPRHHSLALIETGKNGMHHLMVELYSFDDVGQGYDVALQEDKRIATTLGRHTNDFMTSFYAFTPSDFFVEYGWGGRWIDPKNWQACEMTGGPSLWGHERNWLPPEGRAEARRLRGELAAAGVRHPVQVLEGNHALGPGTCPWWDRAKHS